MREQIAQPGTLEPGCRVAGEFLHEQHIDVLTGDQLGNRLGHGPADEQIGRQDAQYGTRRGRLEMRNPAGAQRGAQGSPGCRGRGSRALAAQQQRTDPRSRGYLRGE